MCRPVSALGLAPYLFFFSSRRRHTRLQGDWSSDVCSSDLNGSFACTFRVADPIAFGVVFVVVAVQSRSSDTELPVAVTHSARPFVTPSPVIPRVFVLHRCFLPSCTGRRADVCQTKTRSQSVAFGIVANETSVPSAARALTAL